LSQAYYAIPKEQNKNYYHSAHYQGTIHAQRSQELTNGYSDNCAHNNTGIFADTADYHHDHQDGKYIHAQHFCRQHADIVCIESTKQACYKRGNGKHHQFVLESTDPQACCKIFRIFQGQKSRTPIGFYNQSKDQRADNRQEQR